MSVTGKTTKKKKTLVFHPLLIGLYPVLALLAYNIIQLDPIYALRAILLTILISLVVFLLAAWIARDRIKGGLLASLALFFFLTYGHAYNLLENQSFLGHHRYLIPIWLVLFGLCAWGILRLKKKPKTVSTFLNYFSVVLIVIPFFQIASFELSQSKPTAVSNPAVDEIWQPTQAAPTDSPDVYFIVLDSYTRSDVLKKLYEYDNSAFLEKLREMGFYVADCSKSNYSFTSASISSTLNLDYIDQYAAEMIREKNGLYTLGETIKYSKVRDLFSTLGYRFITFDTSIWWLDIPDSDRFISTYSSPWQKLLDFKVLSNFEEYYLNTTALRAVEEFSVFQQTRLGKAMLSVEKAHYDQVNAYLNELNALPQAEGPKFVYMHLVAPHFPYVFNTDGTFSYTTANKPGYTNEIQYLDQRLLEILSGIIENSSTPPVILLESDHGLSFDVRNANLLAYYLPGSPKDLLYPTLTPVNSFRIVFNQYFGADYPLLPDISYNSSYQSPNEFEIIDYQCPVQ